MMNLKALKLSIITLILYSIAFIIDKNIAGRILSTNIEPQPINTSFVVELTGQVFLLFFPSLAIGFFSLAILFSSRLLLLEKMFQSYSIVVESHKFFARIAQGIYILYLIFYLIHVSNPSLKWFSSLFILVLFVYLVFQPILTDRFNKRISVSWKNSNTILSVLIILASINLILFDDNFKFLPYLGFLNLIYFFLALGGIYNRQIKLRLFSSSLPYRVIDKQTIKQGGEVLMGITLEPIYQVACINNYKPGSFVYVKFPINNQRIMNPSEKKTKTNIIQPSLLAELASQQLPLFILKSTDKNIKLVIQKTDELSSFFCEYIKPKSKLILEGCYGQFNIDTLLPKTKHNKKIVLIAQDIGIVSFLAYLFDYLKKNTPSNKVKEISLIHCWSHNFYNKTISDIQKKIPKLKSYFINTKVNGSYLYKFDEVIDEVITELKATVIVDNYFFICGSKNFTAKIKKRLIANKVARKNIFYELL